MRWLPALILAACAGHAPTPAPSSKPVTRSEARAPRERSRSALLDGVAGDWSHGEHWVAAGGVLWGVVFSGDQWEVRVIERTEHGLQLSTMPGGAVATVTPLSDPSTATPAGRHLTAASGTTAAAAEAADRAFDRDTAARGVDGWVEHFADDGAMLRPTGRIEGHTAIRAAMAPLLAKASLRWAPIWSRLAPDGAIAITVGRAHMEENGEVVWRGSYATVWRRDGDRWRVIFDVGRDQQGS